MNIPQDPIKSLGEAMKELMDDRPTSCAYYHSWEYEDNRSKSLVLDHKIRKCLGEKTWRKKVFRYTQEIDQLDGEMIAGVQESCYRLGFADALLLTGEIGRAKEGLGNIFN
jgi:hypothetical protein